MLLNNFKPLLYFGNGGNFKNVKGSSVNLSEFLGLVNPYADYSSNPRVNALNGHVVSGAMRSFNYNTTTGTNSCIDEQTAYAWENTVQSYAGSATFYYFNTFRANGFVLFVGSGEKEEDLEDYKLENPLVLQVKNASCFTQADGKVITQRTFYNHTEEDVTINEVGLYIFAHQYLSSNQSGVQRTLTSNVVMIGRKVLASPVILKTGEMYTFTYTIDMSKFSFESVDN